MFARKMRRKKTVRVLSYDWGQRIVYVTLPTSRFYSFMLLIALPVHLHSDAFLKDALGVCYWAHLTRFYIPISSYHSAHIRSPTFNRSNTDFHCFEEEELKICSKVQAALLGELRQGLALVLNNFTKNRRPEGHLGGLNTL